MLVVHDLNNKKYSRVYLPFKKYSGLSQVIVSPSFIKGDFGVGRKQYDYEEEYKFSVKKLSPKLITQPHESEKWHKKYKKYGIKTAYISHGFWQPYDYVFNKVSNKKNIWNSFDLIFGGSKYLKECMDNVGVKSQIHLNCLPQLDLLYKSLKSTAKEDKILLFPNRLDLNRFEKETLNFYQVFCHLAETLKNTNYALIVKPKDFRSLDEFILKNYDKGEPWASDIKDRYFAAKNNKNVFFVSHLQDTYTCIAQSKLCITTCQSSVEIESIIAKRNMVVFGSKDVYSTKNCGVSFHIDKLSDLDKIIALNLDSSVNKDNQDKYIKDMGIMFDGKHYLRVLKNIEEFLK